MADPEQMYNEVLQEEQGKGSAGPVAEGRAKAARVRAEHGSPHPKEPKWWPGSQPRWEGGDGAPAEVEAEAEAPAEPEPEPEPEAPAPAAEAPAPAEPAEAPAAAPEQPAPAEQPAAAAAAQPAAQAAPAAVQAPATPTELPPEQRPAGAISGIPSGNRLRPEDAVTTEAQFDGQRAMYERRKLIDELVATGVPEVAAHEAGGARSPWLAVLYLIIPLVAIALLVSGDDGAGEAAAENGADIETGAEPGGAGEIVVVAANVEFDTDEIPVAADQETQVTLDNQDTVPHNISVYEDADAADAQSDALLKGEIAEGGQTVDYTFPPLDVGEYLFQCDIHPSMRGTVVAE